MMKNRLCKSLLCAILMGLLLFSAIYGRFNAVSYAADEYKIYAEDGDVRDYITGHGSYFDVKHSFYKDSDGKVVYCLQSGMRGADESGTSGYQNGDADILLSQTLVNRVNEVVSRGYPSRYGTYIVGGTKAAPVYETGLLIDGTIYKCTAEEARAATAFAVHRQMIEYQKVNPEVVIGNNKDIVDYENGKLAVNDVVNIQEQIFKEGNNEKAYITIEWLQMSADDSLVVTDIPTPSEVNLDNIYLYAKIASYGCVVNSISLMQGEVYVQDAIIEDISYVSAFERIVKIKVPNTTVSNKSRIGIACNAETGGGVDSLIMGNDDYQDIMVITNSNGICEEKEGYMPGGSSGINKLDYDTKNPIAGVGFGIYSDAGCTAQVAVVETDSTGFASVDELESGEYYVKELYTHEGYILDDGVYEISVYPNSFSNLIIYNKRISIKIVLEKQDADNNSGVSQGDATLVGAVYGVYAREDIVRIDGYSGVIHNKDELVHKIVIGKNGKGYVTDLYPGKYYIKEITPPDGYVLDTAEYDVDCQVQDASCEIISRKVVVKDRVKKQSFEILKLKESNGGDEEPLAGAGFKAWLVSDLTVDDDGEYVVTDCEPYPIGKDGSMEMFTDANGYACSAELPYGVYLVRETTVPDGYLPVDDFMVTIFEDSREPQQLGELVDAKERTSVGFIKQDYDSDIAVSGAILALMDSEGNIVDRWESGVERHIVDNLIVGDTYTLVEECAPYGYLKSEDIVFKCEASKTEDGNLVVMKDRMAKGKIHINKSGDIISQVVWQNSEDGEAEGANIFYVEETLENVEFKLLAAEDIVKPDGSGNVVFAKGSEIATAVTDENGIAIFDNLWLGEYLLVETKTSEEHVLNQEPVHVSLAYIDQNTECVEAAYTLKNNRIESTLTVNKYDGDSKEKLAGAEFGVYAEEDIYGRDGILMFPKDYLISSRVSDETGKAVFNDSLIPGKYYIKELKAPDNYYVSGEKHSFEIKAGENTIVEFDVANYKKGIVLGESGTFEQEETQIRETPQQKEAPQQVQTGDEFQPIVVVMLIVAMIAILLLVIYFRLKAR